MSVRLFFHTVRNGGLPDPEGVLYLLFLHKSLNRWIRRCQLSLKKRRQRYIPYCPHVSGTPAFCFSIHKVCHVSTLYVASPIILQDAVLSTSFVVDTTNQLTVSSGTSTWTVVWFVVCYSHSEDLANCRNCLAQFLTKCSLATRKLEYCWQATCWWWRNLCMWSTRKIVCAIQGTAEDSNTQQRT